MNHKEVLEHESMRLYRLRSYVLGELDERVFLALNEDGHVLGLNGYCLDALDELPSGSMSPFLGRPVMNHVVRGMTREEVQRRRDLAERLISEILAEEAKTSTAED